jgi:hypothetical protein
VQFMLWGIILITVIWLDTVRQRRVNS